MPKVGKKEFPYTPKGMAMAKNAAKKAGTKVKYGRGHEATEGAAERKREYGTAKKKPRGSK